MVRFFFILVLTQILVSGIFKARAKEAGTNRSPDLTHTLYPDSSWEVRVPVFSAWLLCICQLGWRRTWEENGQRDVR